MKYLLIFPLFLSVVLTFPSPVAARVLINEVSSFSAEDWVELYNDGSEPVLLSEFRLRDGTESNKLDLDGTLTPHTVVAIDWYNKLNKSGDTVKIVSKTDETKIEDSVTYGDPAIPAPGESQTVGRSANGSAEWAVFSGGTKGSSNETAKVVIPSPTVTSTPTKAPTPTKSPTPTKIPTVTKSPTMTRIPTVGKSIASAVTPTRVVRQSASREAGITTAVLGSSEKAVHPTTVLSQEKQGGRTDSDDQLLVEGVKSMTLHERILRGLPIIGGLISLSICAILLFLHRKGILR